MGRENAIGRQVGPTQIGQGALAWRFLTRIVKAHV